MQKKSMKNRVEYGRAEKEHPAAARSLNLHTRRRIMRLMGHSDDKWRKYLFY